MICVLGGGGGGGGVGVVVGGGGGGGGREEGVYNIFFSLLRVQHLCDFDLPSLKLV